MADITELAQREKFEAWVMTQICICKSTLESLRTADGYRNTTLSGTDYNRMWDCWKAASAEMAEALEKAQTERDEFRNRLKLERSILEDADKRIAELEDVSFEQHKLRELVDLVWNTATESTEVPSTKWADELIIKVFGVYKNDN